MGGQGLAPALEGAVGEFLTVAARWLAYAGGAMLAFLAVMTVASVLGRGLIFIGLSPIKGDYELVEQGTAIAVFFFLPWCQLNRGHVTVDIFVSKLPKRGRIFLELLGNVALAAAAGLIAWRLWLGAGEKVSYGEETYELAIQIGYAMWVAVAGAVLFAVVALYTVWRSVNELARGEEVGEHPAGDA